MNFNFLYIVTIIICIVLCFSPVFAGENSMVHDADVVNESVVDISEDTVVALEDGHFNTSFSDGSNGYCLEYGEQEASEGDIFYKVNTSYAKNNLDNKNVGNYLKLYFVEYTNHALSDKIRTQHMIWHFTDNFNGWRLNYTIIDEVKQSDKIIPDEYVQKLNDTHERVWSFNVLLSEFEHHQNYFNYRFYDRLIDFNSTSSSNSSNSSVEDFILGDNSSFVDLLFEVNVEYTQYDIHMFFEDYASKQFVELNGIDIKLNKHMTGLNLYTTTILLLISIILLILIIVLQKKFIE